MKLGNSAYLSCISTLLFSTLLHYFIREGLITFQGTSHDTRRSRRIKTRIGGRQCRDRHIRGLPVSLRESPDAFTHRPSMLWPWEPSRPPCLLQSCICLQARHMTWFCPWVPCYVTRWRRIRRINSPFTLMFLLLLRWRRTASSA